MAVIEFETSPEHVAYALLGCFIMFFGLVSLFVKEKMFISEAFVSTAFGIIIGPYAIGIFDPLSWTNYDKVTLEFTRIVIAVQVMAAGVSLPRSYMVKERKSLLMMIIPVMILMWLTSALLIWAVIPNLDFIQSIVLAACVTPTDPVLSNSVVKGRFAEKHVPPRIRYLLSAESGINDGMGLPFLFLGLYLLREPTTGSAIGKWFYMVWGYQILLSIVLGGLIGAAARKLVKGAKNRNLIDKESFLAFSIALALAVVGCVSILASDDLLACFIAGNVFAWDDWFSNEIVEAHIQEIIDMLLNLACFVYIGASIPFSTFHNVAIGLSIWRLIVLAILILIFRRLPFVVALKPFIPALATHREAAFAGWFGPIGVGAVFFSKVTAGMTSPESMSEHPHYEERLLRVRAVIYPVVMFLVLSSILIHGVTVPLLHLQYKYTRTWSRKREESSHAVTRLPHINIGDDIIIRPPTTIGNGGSPGTFMESVETEPRSAGHDHQRSPRLDNQRTYNGWSLNFGNSMNFNGGGGGHSPSDMERHHSRRNSRTLEDVVQEMREATRGGRSYRSPKSSHSSIKGTHPLTAISSTEPREDGYASPGDRVSVDMSLSSAEITSQEVQYMSRRDSVGNEDGDQKEVGSLEEVQRTSLRERLISEPMQVGDSPSGSSNATSTTLASSEPAQPPTPAENRESEEIWPMGSGRTSNGPLQPSSMDRMWETGPAEVGRDEHMRVLADHRGGPRGGGRPS